MRGGARGTPRDGAGALCVPVVDSGVGSNGGWTSCPLGLETVAPAPTKRPGDGWTARQLTWISALVLGEFVSIKEDLMRFSLYVLLGIWLWSGIFFLPQIGAQTLREELKEELRKELKEELRKELREELKEEERWLDYFEQFAGCR